MKQLPLLSLAFCLALFAGCDNPPWQSVTAPPRDPVPELKERLKEGVAFHPGPQNEEGGDMVWTVTSLDVSKTTSLTSPYLAKVAIQAVDRHDSSLFFIFNFALNYADGWSWDGNMVLSINGKIQAQGYFDGDGKSVRKIFTERFKLSEKSVL